MRRALRLFTFRKKKNWTELKQLHANKGRGRAFREREDNV